MEMNEDGTLGPEHITDRGIELHSVEQGEQVDVKLPWTLTEKECEQFKAFAAVHGLTVLLDHLGLDGLGNEVNDLYGRVRLLEQREKVAYAKILVATNSNLGGYTRQALDKLRVFARQESGLSDSEALAASQDASGE